MRKTTIGVLSGIAAWLLLLAMLLGGVFVCTTSRAYYRHEYAKYGQAQVIGIDDDGLMRVTNGLLDYLWGKRKTLNMQAEIRGEFREVFNDREKAHMVDVQRLVYLARIAMFSALGLGVALWLAACWIARGHSGYKQWAGIGYLIGAGVLLLIVGIVVLLAIRDFNAVFIQFHLIFFDNDLWLLDSEDMLIQMVPEYFFSDCAVVIAVLFGIGLLLTSALAVLLILRDRSENDKSPLRKIAGSDGESFYRMESSDGEKEEKAPDEEEIFDRFGLMDEDDAGQEPFVELPAEKEALAYSAVPAVFEQQLPVNLEGEDLSVRFEMKLDLKVEKRGDGKLVMVMDPDRQPKISLTSLPGNLSIRLGEQERETLETQIDRAPALEPAPAPEELLRQMDQLMRGYPGGNKEEEK